MKSKATFNQLFLRCRYQLKLKEAAKQGKLLKNIKPTPYMNALAAYQALGLGVNKTYTKPVD